MKYCLFAFALIVVLTSNTFGQLTKSKLIGDWTTGDIDSSYVFVSNVTFYQDINHWTTIDSTVCNTVDMEIQEDNFRLKSTFRCTEPGRELWSHSQSIELKGLPFLRKLTIINGTDTTLFRVTAYRTQVVDRYPYQIKELHLKKIE